MAGLLVGWNGQSRRDDIVLLTSELVTNAVRHAGTDVRLGVTVELDEVRVDVRDGSTSAPRRQDPDPEATQGRGLSTVNALADAWGIEPDTPGKLVWFAIRSDDGRNRRTEP